MTDGALTIAGLRELVAKARSAEGTPNEVDRTIGDLAVALVQEIVELSQLDESSAQRKSRKLMARLLESEEVQRFSTAVTDRVHRAEDPARRLDTFIEVVKRSHCQSHLPLFERAQVRTAMTFGTMLPETTSRAILAKVRSEAAPYVWDAQDRALSRVLHDRKNAGFLVNLNYVGEEVIGDEEARKRASIYQGLVQRPDVYAVSVKLSGIESHIDLTAFDSTLDRLFESTRQILLASLKRPDGPPLVYLDMEAYRDLSLSEALVHRILRSHELDAARLGLAVQTYLPEASGLVERLARTSGTRVWRGGAPLRIRLVKGANLKMEEVEASQRRLSLPTFSSKRAVDANFKRTLRQLLVHASRGRLTAGIASHNLFDLAYAWLLVERSQIGGSVQLEMLEGMAGRAGEIFKSLSGGLLLYAPAVLEENFSSAVSYLVRRLDENTAPENFIRALPTMTVGDASFEEQVLRFLEALATSRAPAVSTFRTQDRNAELAPSIFTSRGVEPFDNVSDTDWTRSENRSWIVRHKKRAHAMVPEVGSILAETVRHTATRLIHGFDPSRPRHGYPVTLLAREKVLAAIEAASTSNWPELRVESRVRILQAAAEGLERRRGELIAAMVYDAGKRADEADIEVSEAIDFARYYGHAAALGLHAPPRGVVSVTPPWNFPLAIPLGGAFAALAAGNTVLLKPAPETPWVAHLAVQICHQAGIPRHALQLLIADEESASPLITDPRVGAVILTGATSTARAFLKMRPGLPLFAETGGKNAAYVSAVADHEGALAEIIKSAFGHSGQKCSALSLLIVEKEVFDSESFRRQLKDAVESLPVGSAWDPRSRITPLIRRPTGALAEIVEQGERYGVWLVRPRINEDNPRLLSPGVLWGIEAGSFPHLTEFFGPVLSVMCAQNFEHGMQLLNQTDYGLTAGLFSLDEREQQAFVRLADAGNLYINRGITGAVVGRQPFGGRKDSSFGQGAKAGGPDYVHQLTKERADAALLMGRASFADRQDSYRRAMKEHFTRVHEGTEVVGERNYFRYTPAPTLLVIGEGVSALDLKTSLLARRLTRNCHPVLLFGQSDALREIFEAEGVSPLLADVEAVVNEATKIRGVRIRLVGHAPFELLSAVAEAGLTLISDPVSPAGRVELLSYLLPQSVSFAYHRHGNTSLWIFSDLHQALAIWDSDS